LRSSRVRTCFESRNPIPHPLPRWQGRGDSFPPLCWRGGDGVRRAGGQSRLHGFCAIIDLTPFIRDTQEAHMEEEYTSRPPRRDRGSRLLVGFILLVLVACALVVAYLVIDTVLQVTSPVSDLPGAVQTQVQEVLN